jgi:hypothetical protein
MYANTAAIRAELQSLEGHEFLTSPNGIQRTARNAAPGRK